MISNVIYLFVELIHSQFASIFIDLFIIIIINPHWFSPLFWGLLLLMISYRYIYLFFFFIFLLFDYLIMEGG